jgi:hypothetical protein
VTQMKRTEADLGASNDPREVVTDPHGRYFGAELNERSFVLTVSQSIWMREEPSSVSPEPTSFAVHQQFVTAIRQSIR